MSASPSASRCQRPGWPCSSFKVKYMLEKRKLNQLPTKCPKRVPHKLVVTDGVWVTDYYLFTVCGRYWFLLMKQAFIEHLLCASIWHLSLHLAFSATPYRWGNCGQKRKGICSESTYLGTGPRVQRKPGSCGAGMKKDREEKENLTRLPWRCWLPTATLTQDK